MRRRFVAPEVVQTSAMDCGPASLKCLLEGFHIPISYGRLREACQTDVDGTSIDTIEEIAKDLGLDCEQIMLPLDHLLLPETATFPAIVVVRLPSGFTHFVVAWRRHGSWVQLMDPSRGRRWVRGADFLREVYVHTNEIPAAAYREWAGSEDFLDALYARLGRLRCRTSCRADVDAALASDDWRPIATLDAAIRLVDGLVSAGSLRRGREASAMVRSLGGEGGRAPRAILDPYLMARPGPRRNEQSVEETLLVRGAVLVRVKGPAAARAPASEPSARPLSPELAAALAESPTGAAKHVLSLLRGEGFLTWSSLAMALAGAVVATAIEAVLFRSIFDLGRILGLVEYRLLAIAGLMCLSLVLTALDLPIVAGAMGLGRRLETRLRLAFLAKIPRLGDRYFQSRATSDMAERCHAIHEVRVMPEVGTQVVRIGCDLLVTMAAIIWLDPQSAPWAVGAAALAAFVPIAFQPVVFERDLRVRSHLGALARSYLDALLGLAAVRTHGAERAVRYEHEAVLVEWKSAARLLVETAVFIEGLQMFAAYAMTVPLVVSYLTGTVEPAALLLLLYWVLNLPTLGRELALLLRQYPTQRNRALRLLEPLGAPEADHQVATAEEGATDAAPRDASAIGEREDGAAIRFEGVDVIAAGHTILQGIDLTLEAGAHVAIVGASGSGKSSLLGTLIGWHRPSAGRIVVDGRPLDLAHLHAMRRDTAWVDPAVQLWNRSLHTNLDYGRNGARGSPASVLEAAELHQLLETLPDGLQTSLGEGGALVSGGEGQRVRFGRALGRKGARLVLLDEPFRGLDRERRARLIARARTWWLRATLLCVTHDIAETCDFDRVIVIDAGRVVEDGPPQVLAADPGSRYAVMLAEEEELRTSWSGCDWRRLRLEAGRLTS